MPAPGHLSPRARLAQLPYVAWIILYSAVLWGLFGALLGAVAPDLRSQLGVSLGQVGSLMSLWVAGGAAGAFLGGTLARRYRPQRLLSTYAGLALLAVSALLLASNWHAVAAALVLIGLCETALFTLGHGLLAEISDDAEERTRVLSLVDVCYSTGTILSPLLVSAAFVAIPSWRAPYAVFGLLTVTLWVGTRMRRRLDDVRFRHDEAAVGPAGAPGYRSLLAHPLVRAVLVSGVCSGFVEWGQYFWFVSYANGGLGLPQQTARLALDGLMVGMTLGRLWQAFWKSRWTMEQKLQGLSLLATGAIGVLALLPRGSPALALATMNVAAGLGVSVGFPILLGSALRGVPEAAPRLSALLMLSFTLGSQLASLGLGQLAARVNLRATYIALALGGVALCLGVRRLSRLLRSMPPADAPERRDESCGRLASCVRQEVEPARVELLDPGLQAPALCVAAPVQEAGDR